MKFFNLHSARNPELCQIQAQNTARLQAGCGLLGRGHKGQFRLTLDLTKTTRNPL